MNKKFIIGLMTIAICVFLVGCGEEKKNNSNENTTTVKTTEKKTNNNSNTIVDDDEILDIDDEDNPPVVKEPYSIDEIVNCPDCVFAYFSAEGDEAKTLGSTVTSSEYTNNVGTLKTPGGQQRHNFFGLKLTGNKISRAYACILKGSKIYCIEGSTNGAYHNSNIAILNKIFTGSQCRTISDGHTYTCTDGSYNGDSKTNGYTSMHYETSCTIYGSASNTGKLICH